MPPSANEHRNEPACPFRMDPAGGDLQAEAAELRQVGPAVRAVLPGGVVAWSVTRYESIKELVSDPRVSRDFRAHWPDRDRVPDGWTLGALTFMEGFLNRYGEEHRCLRRMVSPAFTPKRVRALEETVRDRARVLIAEMARSAPGDVVDLRSSFSWPLTMWVICELLGVPDERREALGAAVDALLDTSAAPERALETRGHIYRLLAELAEYKREHPAPDLTGDLTAYEDRGELSSEELVGTLLLMIGAGFETAVNLITSSVHSLLTHPEHRERLVRGELSAEEVVEESLRRDPPVMHLPMRYAVEDIDLGGGGADPERRGDPGRLRRALLRGSPPGPPGRTGGPGGTVRHAPRPGAGRPRGRTPEDPLDHRQRRRRTAGDPPPRHLSPAEVIAPRRGSTRWR
ncbi:cytochrome P450 [Nocardiopsis alba]|uniref:cytochrome P450 n=1 Tax=Nocardiopsis alba TaxID=53437 RepID=UPI0033EBEFA7